MGVRGFGFLELCVGNARQAAAFFSTMYGFEVVGTAGPRASGRHEVAYVLAQGDARLVVTGAADATSSAADFVRKHGDGVRDIALVVGDVADTHDRAVAAGARSLQGPTTNDRGVTTAVLGAFGDLTHTLVGPDADAGDVIDGYEPVAGPRRMAPAVGITCVDHYAVSVTGGDRERWTRHYCETLGMEHSDDEHVNVDGSAFSMSTVRIPSGGAFVFAEPTPSQRKSQIAGFLESFGGPGVHHIAFATDDIGTTARELRDRGIQTLTVPGAYRDEAPTRLRDVDVPWKELAELGVLVDTDARGHLLQAFTEPLGDRPTTYLEIIQREGMAGFGTANVRHLYSEVLRERALLDID